MPPSGKTTNAKRYWIGVVTAVLGEMPEKYRQQQVLDRIDDLGHLHPHPRPADVTLKGYIKEITDSAVDHPWMDEQWTLGALRRLGTLGINLDAADIKAIMDVHGYALVYGLPITIRRAVWVARLRELVSNPRGLYIAAGRYASAERTSSALHETLDTSIYDADLAIKTRQQVHANWDSVTWELVLASSGKLGDTYSLDLRRRSEARNKIQMQRAEWSQWIDDFNLKQLDNKALQEAWVLAIRAFRRTTKNLHLNSDEIERRVREIHQLISDSKWAELYEALDHKSTDIQFRELRQQKSDG
jgi:hypothetical protein